MPASMAPSVYRMQEIAEQLKERDSGGVARAVDIATRFVAARRGHNGNRQEAIAAVARDCRVGTAALRRFVHPSRRPKSVSTDLWRRLVGAYLRFLRRQLAELDAEIVRVETIARPDDRALRDLLDKAEALADRIRAAIE